MMTIMASAQTRGGEIKRSNSNSVNSKTSNKEQRMYPNKDILCSPSGYINGHGYVDLGLSVKWATANIGARNCYEKGNYYLYGAVYDRDQTVSQIESDIEGNQQYDAARYNWQGSWRLPTKQEFEELLNNCVWKKTNIKGVSGYVVTGHNGNCIFLPLTGSYMLGKKLDVTGYMTGTCKIQSDILGKSTYPYTLSIVDYEIHVVASPKSVRLPIRAVTK